MRELRGIIIDEDDPLEAKRSTDAVPIDVARTVLEVVFNRLMGDAIRFHELSRKANEAGQSLTEVIVGGRQFMRRCASRQASENPKSREPVSLGT